MKNVRRHAFTCDTLPPLRDIIAEYGIDARKDLGQHFLLDPNLTRRIVRAAGDLNDVTVIEIGPGPGGLTRALLESDAKEVVAVERDRRCLDALASLVEAADGRLHLIEGDARRVNIVAATTAPRCIVANLPYNIATFLLIGWLSHVADFRQFTIMVQREVGARIAATPTTRHYGRISVLAQWLCNVSSLFDVSPKAFTPPPKVTSQVVRLVPRPAPLFPASQYWLERVTKAAFGQRRKMLRASLKTICPKPSPLLEKIGIRETARAEELTIADYCKLARSFEARASNPNIK